METTNKRIIIEGEKVHDVGYRPFLLAKARRLRIPNYDAENLVENGMQKIAVSLEGEEKRVQEFVKFVKENYPENVKVLRVREAEPQKDVIPIGEYAGILAAEQQNTVIQSGLGMLGKQNVSIDMQKKMLDKQDKTISEVKSVGDGVKTIGSKVDNLTTTTQDNFKVLGGKVDNLTTTTQDNFNTLNTKYDKISQDMNKILLELVIEREELVKERKESRKSMEKLIDAVLQSKPRN